MICGVLACCVWIASAATAQTEPAKKPEAKPAGRPEPKPAAKPDVKADPKADPALAWLDKVQKYYDRTADYTADFVQVYTRTALSRTSESSGIVKIKKPGMMRWEYTKPAPKLFVADGKELAIYEPEEEQVIIEPHFKTTELSSSVRFLWGDGKLKDHFTATVATPDRYQADAAAAVLELVPNQDATYLKLVLVLDPKTAQVQESILFETSGNINRFRFKNVKANTGLGADTFRFTPPAGIEVIRRP